MVVVGIPGSVCDNESRFVLSCVGADWGDAVLVIAVQGVSNKGSTEISTN
jgi:hypothetical protein